MAGCGRGRPRRAGRGHWKCWPHRAARGRGRLVPRRAGLRRWRCRPHWVGRGMGCLVPHQAGRAGLAPVARAPPVGWRRLPRLPTRISPTKDDGRGAGRPWIQWHRGRRWPLAGDPVAALLHSLGPRSVGCARVFFLCGRRKRQNTEKGNLVIPRIH